MDRQEVINELSHLFKPAKVWATTDSWSFFIETTPIRVLTVNAEFASTATAERLREIVEAMPEGNALVTQAGTLITAGAVWP